MKNQIKFIAQAVKWFDKVNGNTYHSVKITRCKDGKTIACPFTYGYGDSYRWTARDAMAKAKWFKGAKNSDDVFAIECLTHPISWIENHGKKSECITNGKA
jgi:hypothetical protein